MKKQKEWHIKIKHVEVNGVRYLLETDVMRAFKKVGVIERATPKEPEREEPIKKIRN